VIISYMHNICWYLQRLPDRYLKILIATMFVILAQRIFTQKTCRYVHCLFGSKDSCNRKSNVEFVNSPCYYFMLYKNDLRKVAYFYKILIHNKFQGSRPYIRAVIAQSV
jgi:hypothetical protein